MVARLLALSLTTLLSLQAESFNDFLNSDEQQFKDEKQKFEDEKKKIDEEFNAYKKIVDEEFNAYKKSLGKFWDEPETSTQKRWVEYTKDMKNRKVVDFEKNTITIDVHAKDDKQAQVAIAKALVDTVTKDTKQAFDDDQLSQRIEKRLKKAKKAPIARKQILAPLIFKTPPSTREVVAYAKKQITSKRVRQVRSKIPQLKHYSVTIPMPGRNTMRKAQAYLSKAREEARKYKIPLSVVMAVIQTESGFNPMARSHIPAYGLMQIVPRSAGRDVYHYLYKKRRLLSPSFLYNSDNNIKMGTAYLSMIYYKYLKAIDNPQSRLYCTIAAYNTGAGNVARAFSGTTNPYKAAPRINRMSPNQVYNHLKNNLKYAETRHYIQNVSKRAAIFSKALN